MKRILLVMLGLILAPFAIVSGLAFAQGVKGEYRLLVESWSVGKKANGFVLTARRGKQTFLWPIEIGSTTVLKGVKVEGPSVQERTTQSVSTLQKLQGKPLLVNLAVFSSRPNGVVVALDHYRPAQLHATAKVYGSYELKLPAREVTKLDRKSFEAKFKTASDQQWKAFLQSQKF